MASGDETSTNEPIPTDLSTAGPPAVPVKIEPATTEATPELQPETTAQAVGPAEPEDPNGFASLGLDARLVAALAGFGYEEPTPIQAEAIPALLAGRDVIGQADTGTGKTAAFALPIIQKIAAIATHGANRPSPSALVLVPTRELAMQVAEAMHKYGRPLRVSVVPIYGGHSFGQQMSVLKRGVDIVVATPGRAVDHLRRETMDLSKLSILALDEADEMLDMGFADDLEAILQETPTERQTVFFSATLPPRIAGMTKRHLKDPQHIKIAKQPVAAGAAPKVRQTAYIVPKQRKLEALGRILDAENPSSAIVFCRTRLEVDTLTDRLGAHGYRAESLHGGISQEVRSRVVRRLKDGAIDLVIATDVAARGLDIKDLALVVNFDVPTSPESYVHRIGRVGRAGKEGIAITLADPRESRLLQHFERQTKGKINIAQVPTIADLRARRLELTRATLAETIAGGNLESYRVAVESLAQDHDLMQIALAAFKLAHEATGGDKDGPEEEDAFARPVLRPMPKPTGKDFGDRAGDRRTYGKEPTGVFRRNDRAPADDRGGDFRPSKLPPKREQSAPAAPKREPVRPSVEMTRVYVGVGRAFGAGPQDIVDAIMDRAGIPKEAIGTIEVADRYSVVELPEPVVQPVLRAMRKSYIKGRKIAIRRFIEA